MSVRIPHYLLFSAAAAESRVASTSSLESSSASGNWEFVLESFDGRNRMAVTEQENEVTGQRLELLAVVRGLEALDQPSRVTLMTTSSYVQRGMRFGIPHWRDNGWQWESYGRMVPVRNADLWMELDELASQHATAWVWTKGHAGHEDNNRCDWLAQNAAATQRSCWADGRPHAPLRLGLGADYVPPKPQADLFEDAEPVGEDDDDDEDPGLTSATDRVSPDRSN